MEQTDLCKQCRTGQPGCAEETLSYNLGEKSFVLNIEKRFLFTCPEVRPDFRKTLGKVTW